MTMSVKFTVQAAIQQVDALRPRIETLVTSASGFQATDGVEKALKVHADALAVKEGLDLFVPYVVNIQRPVSVDDGNKVLRIIKDLQKSWNIVLDNASKKKSLLDALPAGNITALISEDLKQTHKSMLTLAMIDAAPAEIQVEAKALKKEYEDSIKKVIVVYQ